MNGSEDDDVSIGRMKRGRACRRRHWLHPPDHEHIEADAARFDGEQDGSGSDTTPDEDAEPRGSGLVGRGPAMQVGGGQRSREICDGAGRCSPGRWPPRRRPHCESNKLRRLCMAIRRIAQRMDLEGEGLDTLFGKLARGEVIEDPLPLKEIDSLVACAEDLLRDSFCGPEERLNDRPQPVRIRLLQAVLKEAGDPDRRGMSWFARGIRVGVGVRMPRTPGT